MTGELSKLPPSQLDISGLNVSEAAAEILPQGYAFHGFSGAGDNVRIMQILDRRKHADGAPLYGYGEDGNAERAMARSILTFAMRREQGLDTMRVGEFPQLSHDGQIPTGRSPSRFDTIVWGGDFWMYQADPEVIVAGSNYGGNRGHNKLQVVGSTALEAITMLADNYRFHGRVTTIHDLPAFSFE